MIVFAFLLPFVAGVGLWFGADVLLDRCAPRVGVRAMTVLALTVALSSGLVLCVVAGIGLTQLTWLGRWGGWSADAIADRAPMPLALTIATAAVVTVLVGAAVVHLARAVRSVTATARECRSLGPDASGLVVVDDDRVAAYAVPGSGGRTVISRRLLRELEPDEARAVLAHEDAHLRHRHYLHVQAVELAAAANPLLRRAAARVRGAVESWADDDAAAVVGDRVVVARAIARASLSFRSTTPSGGALGVAATSDAARRVRCLLGDVPKHSRSLAVFMSAVAVACAASALSAAVFAHAMFETAEAVLAPKR